MNNLALKQKVEIVEVKQSAKIIQFPVSKPEIKIVSMSCCKAQMMDWNFSRGF
jgi:hypothetical protein